jgi:hypothetical protein
MFECARCGSSYSAAHLGVEHCPRCRLRDQVQAPLAFKAFQLPGAEQVRRHSAAPVPGPKLGAQPQSQAAAEAG